MINFAYFYKKIYDAFSFFTDAESIKELGYVLSDKMNESMPMIKLIGYSLSVILLAGIVYSVVKLVKVRRKEEEILGMIPESASDDGETKNERWGVVIKHVESDNPTEWRAAILEADIMLDDLMNAQGYSGESLGDKMKSVEKSDFTTIEDAWEAHKVRNTIAHHGSDFVLTQREARRVVELFRNVFNEFHYI